VEGVAHDWRAALATLPHPLLWSLPSIKGEEGGHAGCWEGWQLGARLACLALSHHNCGWKQSVVQRRRLQPASCQPFPSAFPSPTDTHTHNNSHTHARAHAHTPALEEAHPLGLRRPCIQEQADGPQPLPLVHQPQAVLLHIRGLPCCVLQRQQGKQGAACVRHTGTRREEVLQQAYGVPFRSTCAHTHLCGRAAEVAQQWHDGREGLGCRVRGLPQGVNGQGAPMLLRGWVPGLEERMLERACRGCSTSGSANTCQGGSANSALRTLLAYAHLKLESRDAAQVMQQQQLIQRNGLGYR